MVEHPAVNRRVVGSSPTRGAISTRKRPPAWVAFLLARGQSPFGLWPRDMREMVLSKRNASTGQVKEFFMGAFFYILRLKSGRLYPGSTTNLKRRLKEHFSSEACFTTKIDPPVRLEYQETYDTFSLARKREIQIKKWSSKKKEALVSGDLKKLKNLSVSHD
jgi:putative endonuclease